MSRKPPIRDPEDPVVPGTPHFLMSPHRFKFICFVIEGLNSFATVYYLYYIYFFLQQRFGFGNRENLLVAALSGAVYALGCWQAGKLAQRWGYFNALKGGFTLMLLALAAGSQLTSAAGHIIAMGALVLGMCFTWPTLEALTSEGEPAAAVPRMVGIYNVVWAATGALAYFVGGALLEKLGLQSLFYLPAALFVLQIGLTLWLERGRTSCGGVRRGPGTDRASSSLALQKNPPLAPPGRGMEPALPELNPRPIAKSRTFLRLAWLANPCAYLAINTVIAVVPGIASRLGLSAMLAGFCCSVWCFGRLGAFVLLWLWSGWHYRFSWLLAAYLALMATFAAILLVPNLAVLVLAQILFGAALGHIYYSSLFYSMDAAGAKSEHGGIHEAAIGLGNFAGPALGAASLYFLPQYTGGAAVVVSGLLLLGLGGLLAIWKKGLR